MINKYKAICFDYFLTLVYMRNPMDQIEEWITNTIGQKYPEINSRSFFKRYLRIYASLCTNSTFHKGIDILCISMYQTSKIYNIQDISHEYGVFVRKIFHESVAYFDSIETVNYLKEKYRVGLLTNADNDILNESIKKESFLFDFIISSEDTKCTKPDRKIFKYACEKLHLDKEEILLVGDSQYDDIMGAGRSGIDAVWVNRRNEILKEGIVPPQFEISRLSELVERLL